MTDQVGTLYVKLEADLTQLKAELRKMRGQVKEEKQHFAGLQTAIAGAFTVGVALKAAGTVAELAKIGAEAQRTRQTFYNLGGSAEAIQELRQATRGMVDDVSAMRAATKFLAMGLAEDTAEAAELAEVATQLGTAMSMDAGVAMADFAALLANQSIPRLDNFGISSGRVRARIAELQTETKGLSREQAFLTATMEEARKTLEKVGEQGIGTAADLQTLATMSKNIKTLLGEIVAEGLAASGVMGVLGKAVRGLQNALENTKSFSDIIAGFRVLTNEGALTEGQFQTLRGEANALQMQFRRGRIDAEEFAAGLEELEQRVANFEMPPPQALEEFLATLGEVNEAMALPDIDASAINEWETEIGRAFSDFERRAASVPKALADAMSSQAIGDAIRDMGVRAAQIMEDIESGLLSVVEEGEQRRSDLQLRHNLDRLKAQQRYEQEYSALVTAGRTEDAASLQTTFAQKQGMADHQYAIDEQMLDRTMLVRKITRAKAYVAELTAQSDQIRRTFATELAASKSFQKLEIGTQQAILNAIFEGGSAQLQLEASMAEARRQISAEISAGIITDAVTAREAVVAAIGGDLGAAKQALNDLQGILDGWKPELPPLPTFDLGDVGGVGGVGGGGRQIAETVTKPLSQAVDEIARSVANAKQAMQDLIGFELGEGVAAGFDQLGEFVKLGVSKFYGWLHADEGKLKTQLEAIKEFLAPIRDLFSASLVDLTRGKPMADFAEADRYFDQLKGWSGRVVDWMVDIRDKWDRVDDLNLAAELAPKVKALFGIMPDLSKGAPMADFGTIDRYFDQMKGWSGRVVDWMVQIRDDFDRIADLNLAAELAPKVKALFDIMPDFSRMAPMADFGTADRYLRHLKAWGGRIVDWMMEIKNIGRVADVKEAAKIAEDVEKLFGLVGVDYSKMADTTSLVKASANLDLYIQLHKDLGVKLMDWLKNRSQDVKDQVKEAAALSVDVKTLFDVLTIDPEAVKAPDKGFVGRVKALTEALEEALGLGDQEGVVDIMERIRTRWGDTLIHATTTMEHITSIFTGLGDVIAAIRAAVMTTAEMGGSFVPYARALFNQLAHVAALAASVPGPGAAAAAGVAAGAGAGASETTINVMIGEDVIARIVGTVIGQLRIKTYETEQRAGLRIWNR